MFYVKIFSLHVYTVAGGIIKNDADTYKNIVLPRQVQIIPSRVTFVNNSLSFFLHWYQYYSHNLLTLLALSNTFLVFLPATSLVAFGLLGRPILFPNQFKLSL